MSLARPLIAIIDPSVDEPCLPCFNQLGEHFPEYNFTIHFPCLFGMDSLKHTVPDGIIIFGSAGFVTDREPWMLALAHEVDRWLKLAKPALGICFGHQLMAQHYGAVIDYVSQSQDNFEGVRAITFTEDFPGFKGETVLNLVVTHHQEVKKVPPAMKVIASSDDVRIEALCHRSLPYWSVQSHPEASRFFMTHHLQGLTEPEMEQAAQDGRYLIKQFLQRVDKSKRSQR